MSIPTRKDLKVPLEAEVKALADGLRLQLGTAAEPVARLRLQTMIKRSELNSRFHQMESVKSLIDIQGALDEIAGSDYDWPDILRDMKELIQIDLKSGQNSAAKGLAIVETHLDKAREAVELYNRAKTQLQQHLQNALDDLKTAVMGPEDQKLMRDALASEADILERLDSAVKPKL